MAILLGAFIIQGLVPGPPMLIPESQGGHLTLTFSFVWIVVVSNIITVSVCFLFLNQLTKITRVRGSLVIPFILLLVYLGGFAEKNLFEDLVVVLIFGALGWVMVQLDWPRPPLILGLVLGRLAENNLFLATDNYGLAWIKFPGVIFIFVVILAGTFYPVYQRWRERQTKEQKESSTASAEPISLWAPVFTVCLIALFAWSLWESRDWGYRSGLFPWAIGIPGLILALFQLDLDISGVIKTRAARLARKFDRDTAKVGWRTLEICSWIIGFFLAIWFFGFAIAVPLMTFLYLKVGGKEPWPISIILTVLAWVSFYGVFDYALHVPFPKGLLFEWLKPQQLSLIDSLLFL